MPRSSDRDRPGRDRLAENVRRLSRLLTRERELLPEAYLRDPGLRSAYLEYFLPANLPKVHTPLHELALHDAGLLRGERLRVLDIGTGPGTSMFGVMTFFAGRQQRPALEFTAIDTVAENLRDAERLFPGHAARYGAAAGLRTIRGAAEETTSTVRQEFDIVILSNVLNELFAGDRDRTEKRVQVIAGILRLLGREGSCIVIEPALRATSRDLLQVRNGMLDAGASVYAPCLVQSACPALLHPKDWCHEERPWHPPAVIREIDERIGLRKDALKFSYAVFRKDGRSLRDCAGADAVRVVSEPMITKGKREYVSCGPAGRRLVVRLDKDATRTNEPFGRLQRGDLVRFSGLADEERRFRVMPGTAVRQVLLPDRAVERRP